MNFLLLASTLLSTATASFSGDLSAAKADADNLASRVEAWNSHSGILGAFGIQNYYPTLSSAVSVLSQDAGSIKDSDVDPSQIHSFAASIVSLLDALTSKATDFSKVGASGIVKGDLQGLGQPAADIVKDIVGAVESDCSKVKSLTPDLNSLESAFSSANSAFGVGQLSFTKAPSC